MTKYSRKSLVPAVFSLGFSLGVSLALAACTNSPPAAVTPDLTFSQVKPITLNVGKIEIVNRYSPPMKSPNVDHLFRQPPIEVAHQLVEKKLQPGGAPDRLLRVIVEDASVTRTDLPVDDGLAKLFTRQPAEKYHAHVALRFELVNADAPDVVLAHAEIGTEREKTLDDDASPADRDEAYLALDEALVGDLNGGMDDVVKKSFGGGM